jgi:hypothetical protein
MNFLTAVIPTWARWLILVLAALFLYAFGRMDGERIEGVKHLAYVAQQAQQGMKIVQAQQKVVTQTEIKYRDRIQTVYVKGDTIIKEVPTYVTQADNDRCTINAGFVRVYDAAWSGEPAGPAADPDREPAGVSLTDVAETDAFNAKVCKVWREQALGWREYFDGLKKATQAPDGVP